MRRSESSKSTVCLVSSRVQSSNFTYTYNPITSLIDPSRTLQLHSFHATCGVYFIQYQPDISAERELVLTTTTHAHCLHARPLQKPKAEMLFQQSISLTELHTATHIKSSCPARVRPMRHRPSMSRIYTHDLMNSCERVCIVSSLVVSYSLASCLSRIVLCLLFSPLQVQYRIVSCASRGEVR